MAACDVSIAAYCRLIAAELKQFLLHKLQSSDSQYLADFLAEICIFWQPMAARLYISLCPFYGAHKVVI